MNENVLETIKAMLGLDTTDTTGFEEDILVGINSSIGVLNQLGVCESDVLVDEDTEWSAITEEPTLLGMAKNLIYMKTRLIFDPPTNSFIVSAYENQINELTWRIQVQVDLLKKGVSSNE